jgi:hypothetical protein
MRLHLYIITRERLKTEKNISQVRVVSKNVYIHVKSILTTFVYYTVYNVNPSSSVGSS